MRGCQLGHCRRTPWPLACGVGPWDEVIVPSFTFAATANAVALTGATPVFADIDARTFCLDPASVGGSDHRANRGDHASPSLRPSRGHVGAFQQIADRHGLRVFEDAAQAHGAAIDGKPVGTFGDFGMFSLYPTKNMTAGEGGMDSCANDDIARQLRLLRNQGMERRYENEVVGFNARMTDIHAAIGRVQLTKFASMDEAAAGHRRLSSTAELKNVTVPFVADGVNPRVSPVHDRGCRRPRRLRYGSGGEHQIGTGHLLSRSHPSTACV